MISGQGIKQYLSKNLPALSSLYGRYQNGRIVKNFFKTSFSKNVLICYITNPFRQGATLSHTNMAESLQIAEAFKNLGYNCDIINYDSTKKINFSKYNIIFGFGEVLRQSFYSTKKNIKRIYYGTGKHPYFSNAAAIKRGLDFQKDKGVFLADSLRLVDADYALQTMAVDALVLLGDKSTVASYNQYFHPEIYRLNVSFFKVLNYLDIIKNKDFFQAKNNFLFFSGGGMIHKGLDIVLDFFKDRKNLFLHICAPVESENNFKKIYQKEIFESDNIYFYKFIDIRSEIFKNLLEKCAFIIMPSCSEGMPTSVITVIGNGGLIPILSEAASVGLDEYTIFIDDFSQKSLENSITRAMSADLNTLEKNSREIGKIVNDAYTIQEYSKNIGVILDKITNK